MKREPVLLWGNFITSFNTSHTNTTPPTHTHTQRWNKEKREHQPERSSITNVNSKLIK